MSPSPQNPKPTPTKFTVAHLYFAYKKTLWTFLHIGQFRKSILCLAASLKLGAVAIQINYFWKYIIKTMDMYVENAHFFLLNIMYRSKTNSLQCAICFSCFHSFWLSLLYKSLPISLMRIIFHCKVQMVLLGPDT